MNKVLLDRLEEDFPEVKLRQGRKFLFRPPRTIVLGPAEKYDSLLLLHEFGHYLCGHHDFDTDARRVRCECEAWEKARELCEQYGVEFNGEFVEAQLDSYRDYLDQKSRCPKCGLTRFQTPDGAYHCPFCEN